MNTTQNRRTSQDWLDIITACRQSGMSDRDWCDAHGVSIYSFYGAITRLRKKSYTVPERDGKRIPCEMDFTSRQDVVRVDICNETTATAAVPAPMAAPATAITYLDNSHTIEIAIGSASIRVGEHANPELLDRLMRTLLEAAC